MENIFYCHNEKKTFDKKADNSIVELMQNIPPMVKPEIEITRLNENDKKTKTFYGKIEEPLTEVDKLIKKYELDLKKKEEEQQIKTKSDKLLEEINSNIINMEMIQLDLNLMEQSKIQYITDQKQKTKLKNKHPRKSHSRKIHTSKLPKTDPDKTGFYYNECRYCIQGKCGKCILQEHSYRKQCVKCCRGEKCNYCINGKCNHCLVIGHYDHSGINTKSPNYRCRCI